MVGDAHDGFAISTPAACKRRRHTRNTSACGKAHAHTCMREQAHATATNKSSAPVTSSDNTAAPAARSADTRSVASGGMALVDHEVNKRSRRGGTSSHNAARPEKGGIKQPLCTASSHGRTVVAVAVVVGGWGRATVCKGEGGGTERSSPAPCALSCSHVRVTVCGMEVCESNRRNARGMHQFVIHTCGVLW